MKDQKVVPLNCVTRLNLPPERVLEAALEETLSEVVIVGYDEEGDFYFASSQADGGDVLWLLELAKQKLMRIAEDG